MTDVNKTLASNYVLVDLSISRWNGRRLDKDLSDDTAKAKRARQGSIRTTKQLLAGADYELKKLNAALTDLREFIYSRTLPWSTNEKLRRGPRLLPVARIHEVMQEFARRQAEVKTLKADFLESYPARVEEAIDNLGDAANPADYPTVSELDDTIKVRLDILPVPSGEGFAPVSLPTRVVEQLAQRMEARQRVAVRQASLDMAERLAEQAHRMAERLQAVADYDGKGKKPKIYDSLVGNIEDLLDLAESMDDLLPSELKSKIADARTLVQHPVETFKTSPETARQTAQAAADVASAIDEFINNF